MDLNIFSDRLQVLMDSHGMSGADLAKAINSTNASVSRYLNRLRVPTIDQVYHIAQYFHVSMDWLLGLDEVSSNPSLEPNTLLTLYSKASEDDRRIIQTILHKYK